tara:strand:- start:329 stop:550 length:222 start_codon:yes stop_codon:yes gene_type:complete
MQMAPTGGGGLGDGIEGGGGGVGEGGGGDGAGGEGGGGGGVLGGGGGVLGESRVAWSGQAPPCWSPAAPLGMK